MEKGLVAPLTCLLTDIRGPVLFALKTVGAKEELWGKGKRHTVFKLVGERDSKRVSLPQGAVRLV